MNWEPNFTCQHEQRLGGMGDGPKWVCDPHRIANEQKDCLVYSIGSNNNFAFEESVHKEISNDCEIHTFDPTISENPSNKPDYVHFHKWGLGIEDKEGVRKKRELYSMSTIVEKLGHKNRRIDIFKIDCEGCEWSTYKHWFGNGVDIRQIQVELHDGTDKAEEGKQTPVADSFLSYMKELGYVTFHKEANILTSGNCIEYAFLKLDKSFFA